MSVQRIIKETLEKRRIFTAEQQKTFKIFLLLNKHLYITVYAIKLGVCLFLFFENFSSRAGARLRLSGNKGATKKGNDDQSSLDFS